MKKLSASLSIIALGLCIARPAAAYDGDVTGKIANVNVKANVPHQRVAVVLDKAACPNHSTTKTVYLNANDQGDAAAELVTKVALTAFLAGKKVRARSDWNGSSRKCELQQLQILSD